MIRNKRRAKEECTCNITNKSWSWKSERWKLQETHSTNHSYKMQIRSSLTKKFQTTQTDSSSKDLYPRNSGHRQKSSKNRQIAELFNTIWWLSFSQLKLNADYERVQKYNPLLISSAIKSRKKILKNSKLKCSKFEIDVMEKSMKRLSSPWLSGHQ